jgi:hypothetical protein
MPAFRRVQDRHAGPSALGILVPQGHPTQVILRPRALEWDLLPLRSGGEGQARAAFCQFGRDEAAAVARHVQQALEAQAGCGVSPVEAVANPHGEGYLVCARIGEYTWIVCQRVPGRPYEVMLFATAEGASDAAVRVARFLVPGREAGQEYYFNTQNFSS